jgi:hypothetical protein
MRVIQKGCFWEIYVNDDYAMGVRLETSVPATRFGTYAESADGRFSGMGIHALR